MIEQGIGNASLSISVRPSSARAGSRMERPSPEQPERPAQLAPDGSPSTVADPTEGTIPTKDNGDCHRLTTHRERWRLIDPHYGLARWVCPVCHPEDFP